MSAVSITMSRSFVALLVSLTACGTDDHSHDDVDCAKVSGADVFVVGLQKAGSSGALDFKMMSASPAPPARGDNSWVVQISSLSSGAVGAPVEGATLTVTPFMPAHQHGTPIAVEIAPMTDPGHYKLEPVNLWMPGVWETTIRASTTSTSDSVVYRFCID